MADIKDSIKLLRFNMKWTVVYEVVLQIVAALLFVPVYFLWIRLTIQFAGLEYLSKENMMKFFKAPTTYLMVLLLLLIVNFYLVLQVSGISAAYNRANYMKKTSPFRMFGIGLKNALRVFSPRNWGMLLFLPFYLPVIGTAGLTLSFMNYKLPFYVEDFVKSNQKAAMVAFVIYVLLCILNFRFVLVMQVFTAEKIPFVKAIKRTKTLIRENHYKPIWKVAFWTVLILGSGFIVRWLMSGPILKWILSFGTFAKITSTAYVSVEIVLCLIYAVLAMPLMYCFIVNAYFNCIPNDESLPNIDAYSYDVKSSRKKEIRFIFIIVGIALIADMTLLLLSELGVFRLNTFAMTQFTITAHRGDSDHAPENTLAAFDLAIENGADVVELDCRETSDGVVVVAHDASLKRTAGVKKEIQNMTFEELRTYSVGEKWMKDYEKKHKEASPVDYSDEKIPTLEETIELVGDRAKLCIELKPTSKDEDLEEKVVAIIEEYDYVDQCVVQSLSYKSIEKVKKLNPEIQTIYVMALAMGDFDKLPAADGYNIKEGYITNIAVQRAHARGKVVYAWNVDDKETLQRMMAMHIDSVVTDDPTAMRKAMYAEYYGSPLEEFSVYLGNTF